MYVERVQCRYILAHTPNVTIDIEGKTVWLDLDGQIAVTTGIFTFAFIYEHSVCCHFFIAFVPFWQSRQQVRDFIHRSWLFMKNSSLFIEVQNFLLKEMSCNTLCNYTRCRIENNLLLLWLKEIACKWHVTFLWKEKRNLGFRSNAISSMCVLILFQVN